MRKYYNKVILLKGIIESYFKAYGIDIQLTEVKIISEFQRLVFKVKIKPGVRVKAIYDYARDIKLALQLPLFLPFEKENSIFLAVSEVDNVENSLLKILSSNKFVEAEMQIPLALGYDYLGEIYIADLAKMVHLLIAGPSGTGKSVALKCAILSMITRCSIDELRLILFDIGGNSLTVFKDVKHLYHPLVKDSHSGLQVLEALVTEIESRTLLGEDECKKLPFLVCVIDEFDDTIANIKCREERSRFQTLLRNVVNRGRKAKVIIIITSLDPSEKNADVNINGIGSRISFKYLKHQKSSNALGMTGAENLSGDGAMIFVPKSGGEKRVLQGAYITDEEIHEILNNAPEGYEDLEMLEVKEVADGSFISEVEKDISFDQSRKELADVIAYTLKQEKISANKIQQRFNMGNRARNIIDLLCQKQIVSEKKYNQPREVIPTCIEELSEEILTYLEKYGYTKEQLKGIFQSRNNSMLCDMAKCEIE